MYGANDPSTLQRAHALLAAQQGRRSDPDFRSELLSTSLACHSRMLALGDSDPRAAANLALAGADLLQAFQQLEGSSSPPDWVLIHEEQCCRYGALWIHGLLQEGHHLESAASDARRAIGLLERLQQLHPEPVAWIAPMQKELAGFSRARSADDLRVVVVGNCQAHPLTLGLRQALPQARIHATPSVHLATPNDVAVLHRCLPAADLLVMHRVQPGYREDIGLDAVTLGRLLPPAARRVVLPNLHYEGHHPWIAYAHDPDGRLADLEAQSPLGAYHDFLAMVAARDALPLDTLLDPSVCAEREALLLQQHHLSLTELERREADCDLGLSDWLACHHQALPLAHTINHPAPLPLDQLLRRLLLQLDLPHQLGPAPFEASDALGALSIPIHPWVRQALKLASWADSWGQRAGSTFTIAQQLQESLEFYRLHPWIAAHNATHPKLKLAEQLLSQPDHSVGGPVSMPALRRPQTAALINYYNDEDMLAWQLESGCLDHYDRIYIWDGPYDYLHRLELFGDDDSRLDGTPLGERLLGDPRVIYRHRRWRDEAEKRVDAYAAVQEDLVILHDTDEFFQVDHQRLMAFWQSPYAVASQRTQNLYAGGLHGSDAHHTGVSMDTLPLKRVLFRRQAITPERHLDYCWLVGVQQQPTDERLVQPEPIGHAYHLTACRTARGQATKMAFYMSLALAKRGQNPVVQRLNELVAAGQVSRSTAKGIFLRGDAGYAGVPNPAFGLRLRERLHDPVFPQATLEAMLAHANSVAEGSYPLLSGYPLQLWFPAESDGLQLKLLLGEPATFNLQSWIWRRGNTAAQDFSVRCHSAALQLERPHESANLGWLVSLTLETGTAAARLHTLTIERTR